MRADMLSMFRPVTTSLSKGDINYSNEDLL